MKKIVGLLCLAMSLCSGCSIYKAATAPSPLPLENVKIGQNRNAIIAAIGLPKSTEVLSDTRTDVHEFVHGYNEGTKARVILYAAGDIFTAGLTELLFWPIELAAGQGTEGRAVVTYGMDNIAKAVLLTKKDGGPWEYASNQTLQKTSAAAVTQ